eukprot:gene26945-4567_t
MEVERIQEGLSCVGFGNLVPESILFPGQEREQLVFFLLNRLVSPANLDTLLSKLPVPEPASRAMLSSEERQAQKLATLLNSLGIPATADLIRGCAEDASSNLVFIMHLITLVQTQQQLQQLAPPTPSRGASPSPLRHPPSTATAHDDEGGRRVSRGGLGEAPPSTSNAEVKLMDFATSNFCALTTDSVQGLFPSDINKALQRHSSAAASAIANCWEWSDQLGQTSREVQTSVEQLRSAGVLLVSDAEWQALSADLAGGLQQYLEATEQFLNIYNTELRVWCESLAPPQMFGFGAKASTMLGHYHKLGVLLDSLDTIRRLHAAIASSAHPLQGYQPRRLHELAERGQRESSRMRDEVEAQETRLRLSSHMQQAACT